MSAQAPFPPPKAARDGAHAAVGPTDDATAHIRHVVSGGKGGTNRMHSNFKRNTERRASVGSSVVGGHELDQLRKFRGRRGSLNGHTAGGGGGRSPGGSTVLGFGKHFSLEDAIIGSHDCWAY
jgi:hypothetical protein